MTQSSGSALALASRLRALSDPELAALVRSREIRETGIRDYFDLADKLLDRNSIQSALTGLDRRTLLTLSLIAELSSSSSIASVTEVAKTLDAIEHPNVAQLPSTVQDRAERLAARALIAIEPEGFVCYDAVREQLHTWPTLGLPSAEELAAPIPGLLGPVGQVDATTVDHVAAENAFATATSVAELATMLGTEPARELARGGLGLPDTKRLTAVANTTADRLPALLQLAARAGILTVVNGRWGPTSHAAEWALLPAPQRWGRLAGSWVTSLPNDIRFILADRSHSVWGEHFEEYLAWLYPAADPKLRARIDVQVQGASLLGIIADNAPSNPGTQLLVNGQAAAEEAMALSFPADVENVYLQHDLSIVSPGPLAPPLDVRLRIMADVESRAQASTYRVTAESINRALSRGETAASILEFFSGISLTGIPQPLDYLVAESAARFGSLRVGTVTNSTMGAVSYIHSDDENLLDTVLVDQRLSSLGLRRSSRGWLVSRFTRDIVYWSLVDARYPAAAEDGDQQLVQLDRHTWVREPAAAADTTSADAATALVARLREAAAATANDSETPWLQRQIELAIKAKMTLTVTVGMPDGTHIDYLLEPASLAGGRLRARDRKADIERTLPLSYIVAVTDGPE